MLDKDIDDVVTDLKDQIESLSPPAKLRLAADLLENGKPEIARTIAERVALELGLALTLRKIKDA